MTTRGLVLLVLCLCPGAVHAASDDCMGGAKTDLEKLYCQVVSEGQGAGLPSPTDFKRNDPQVQALLLRRPAGRLGLEVPEPGAPAAAAPAPRPIDTESEPDRPEPEVDQPQYGQLADCRLQGERIACPQQRYNLAMNQPNSKLESDVLGEDNRLGLSPFRGDRNDEQAVRRYLSDAYDRYIPRMLDIGLGANTMSFTAFHNAFHTMEAGGVDFAERMERTYSLLKQDKKTLAVKARYHDELPEDLSLCTVINPDIIVCDNVGTNWVYVSPSR
ncbi:hypothetical protein [Marinobacter sp. ATCH36]|uniref:hypothetical protein n=1 Tax=Marinobacter sp. ATCH36 TaxID=2945106 RepID=UPI0020214475|nr:hypothetical protein [Marinobacter sp. ATCH36]MCL7942816.1 hypothetical protein [Marinobacter sp. ATCH36]